jgi:putative flippase GtrA
MGNIRNELWTFTKAQFTAQIATLTDFAVSLLLAEVFGLWYVWSSFLGALTGGLVNCSMNYRWVFHAEGLKKKDVAAKYIMVWTGSILLNTLGTYSLTELSQQHFLFAKAFVAVCVAVFWNYYLQRNFVYKETHLKDKIKKITNI